MTHRRSWVLIAGTMYWMLNSDYPSSNWGSIDVDGRWRLTHYAMAQSYSPLLVTAVVATLPGAETPPPPPPAPTCQRHFDMNREGTTVSQFHVTSPSDCCVACGNATSVAARSGGGGHCEAYSWLGGLCFLSNSSGYHRADTRNLVSGLCTENACTKTACSTCSTPEPPVGGVRSLIVHVANDWFGPDRSAEPIDSSAVTIELIRFSDAKSVVLDHQASPIQSGSGAVIYSAPVADVLRGSRGLCGSVSDCFALARFRPGIGGLGAITNTDGGLALLSNFKNLALRSANVTLTCTAARSIGGGSGGTVTLAADAVTLYAVVTSSLRGRFDRNGVLLQPGVQTGLMFLPWGQEVEAGAGGDPEEAAAAFCASLTVEAVNLGSVTTVV